MDIIVCMKLVPNTAHMTFNPKTMRLERHEILCLINPADINALECALNMKKKTKSHEGHEICEILGHFLLLDTSACLNVFSYRI